MRTVFELSKTR